MKKLLFLLFIFSLLSANAQSYRFNITGTIQSEKDKKPIEAATIHLEKVKDSTVLSYTISDEKGNFSLEGKSYDKNMKLYISFIGMNNYSKLVSLDKESNIKLGVISLKEESNLLNEVVIKSRAPITVKKDTLEFNVKSFKTKKDANVEDLLKKLPGVEVDEQGKITVNGKPVNKVLVNGKPFFGDDPTITTKNLTKEIIEKVQITDSKSKSEAFTGEKGDANNKTINLTIKKENNKGWFGRVTVGGGTDERYEGATMVNRFNNNTRFSLIAGTNNINSPGFSFGEIQKMYGGGSMWMSSGGSFSVGGRSFGGGNGIVTSKIGGFTYADEYKKGFDINANYIFSESNSNDVSKNNRAYNLPDRQYFTNTTSLSNNDNTNHNFDTELDIKIDSTFLINIRPKFTFNSRTQNSNRNEESLDENSVLTNRFSSTNFSDSETKSFENKISITKKFGRKGSFLKAVITNRVRTADRERRNNSIIEIFGTDASTEIRDQKSTVSDDLNSIRSRLTYRIPILEKKLFIDAKYRYSRSERENIDSTFDFNATDNSFSDFNIDLSSNFEYNDITTTPSLSLEFESKKFNIGVEMGKVYRTLENLDKLRPNLNLNRTFNNLLFSTNLRYSLKKNGSIYLNYSIDNNPPSISQIQPFTNVRNPSNLITGNPNLKPSQSHRVYLNINKYNWQKRTGFFAYISGNLRNDQIVNKTSIDDNLISTTTYENVDGAYDFWGGANYNKSFKLDSITSVNARVGINSGFSKNINLFNEVKNISKSTSLTPNLGFEFTWNKVLSIEPRYEISFTKTTFNNEVNQLQNFTSHSLNIRTRTNVPKKLEWRNDIRYSFNPNVIGFNRAAWFWNSTLAYSILKDKASITLKAYDLLNQNTNARRRTASNYIEDTESTVLQQYFMLGFSWKFNSLGKKGKVNEYNFNF